MNNFACRNHRNNINNLTVSYSINAEKKGWQLLLTMMQYVVSVKFYRSTKKNHPILLFPYEKINEATIKFNWQNQSEYIAGFKLTGFNISLLSEEEQKIKIDSLWMAFKTANFKISLIKLQTPIDLGAQINFYETKISSLNELLETKQISKQGYHSRKEQLQGFINDSNQIMNEKVLEMNNFFLLIYADNEKDVLANCSFLEQNLFYASLNPQQLRGNDLTKVINSLYFANEWNERELEIMIPDTTNFGVNSYQINNRHYKVSAIVDFPNFVRNGWLYELCNIKNTTIVFHINHVRKDRAQNQLANAISNIRTNSYSNNKVKEYENIAMHHDISTIDTLLHEITIGEEEMKSTNLLVIAHGETHKDLQQKQYDVEKVCHQFNMKMEKLKWQQKEAFLAILPKSYDELIAITGKEMPAKTVAGSFPFFNSSLIDSQGLFLGLNTTGDVVYFDQTIRDQMRKNSNQLILGTSGSGKSYSSKKELNYHIAIANKVIIIDPEREYQNLCYYHERNWIDVGKSTKGKINPLQIFNGLDDDNEDLIANHLQFLEEWMTIASGGLHRDEKITLAQQLKKLYEQKQITNANVLKLANNEFPTMQELYELVKQGTKENKQDISLKNLTGILSRFDSGAIDAYLWNGYTTLDVATDLLTVFDLYTLTESGNQRVINAQMFLILKYIENIIRKNKNWNDNNNKEQWINITIDEAHLLIDPQFPVALNFMYQMVKRIRKYNGMMNIITQNIKDFAGTEAIKRQTTAIMNGIQYLKILNLNPDDLNALDELYRAYGGITDYERNFVSRARVGEMLFSLGGYQRMILKINVSTLEQAAIENEVITND